MISATKKTRISRHTVTSSSLARYLGLAKAQIRAWLHLRRHQLPPISSISSVISPLHPVLTAIDFPVLHLAHGQCHHSLLGWDLGRRPFLEEE